MSEAPSERVNQDFVAELTNQQTAMLAYIRSLVPGSPNARDLLQEVNIILWQKRDVFMPGTNFKAWAFQIIRYHLMNHKRKLVSQGWLVFDDDLMESMAADEEENTSNVNWEARHKALKMCLGKLRPQDRDILHHRYATDSSLNEFAKLTKRSTGTLKATLFNLRAALKKCIEQHIPQFE